MKNKIGGSLGLQVIIVLIIAIGFVLIYFMWLKDYRVFADELTDYTICKNSNFENAKAKLKFDNQVIAEKKGNKCKTEYIKDIPKGKETEFIAKKLAGCWDQYLEGREELFYTEDNNFCAICSVLYFDDDKEITDLTSYLMETDVPTKPGITYFEYLNRVVVTDENLEEVRNSELEDGTIFIDTEKDWSIIFIEGKDVNPGSLTGESSIVSAKKGALFGVIAGLVTIVGFGLCGTGVGCIIGAFLVAAGTGGGVGYLIGSDSNPDLDSRVLLWPYTPGDKSSGIKPSLAALDCTVLEGQDGLEVKKFD